LSYTRLFGTVVLSDLTGGHDIGGLVGRNDGTINRCFAIADLSVLLKLTGYFIKSALMMMRPSKVYRAYKKLP